MIRAAVGQGTEVVDGEAVLARDRKSHGFSPGRQDDRSETPRRAVLEREAFGFGIESGHLSPEGQFHRQLVVVGTGVQR